MRVSNRCAVLFSRVENTFALWASVICNQNVDVLPVKEDRQKVADS